jgi:hypothetical protein
MHVACTEIACFACVCVVDRGIDCSRRVYPAVPCPFQVGFPAFAATAPFVIGSAFIASLSSMLKLLRDLSSNLLLRIDAGSFVAAAQLTNLFT